MTDRQVHTCSQDDCEKGLTLLSPISVYVLAYGPCLDLSLLRLHGSPSPVLVRPMHHASPAQPVNVTFL